MITALFGGIVAGLAVAVPVGAVGTLIVMTGAHRGWRVAAAGGLGAATVDTLYASLAVIGGSAVTAAVGSVATPLRWLAGLVLLTLGAMMLRSGWASEAGHRPPVHHASSAPRGRLHQRVRRDGDHRRRTHDVARDPNPVRVVKVSV
ncbi:LysE family transporter [Gordonia rubripertincta]|uniref:LysE family transporter n=2 Tax=Gordonia rubripertincta TaxID=36822 RepID=A0AAW6RGM1_GORRU|nr:LysE family transporter [Gordonia rubripertincta]MDG6783418.1 LysE family transporter [Gordonia rubripertincta]NKY62140.1 LysE family transporter [Gordonia rubripertincta]GAB83491.1 hypothetical protein GORBP_012_00030 [Gordonia rubripertincta NBRC 101908]